ncbi:DUF4124 domain-containing protein [Paucimonas lemoignei]|nr:DUF4124 domain-containing protein [Paucimonas lemoignei]
MSAICFCTSAQGVDIYRWVDDDGHVHFSDKAPARSSQPVTRMDSRQFEVSRERRREAEKRAAHDRERSAEVADRIERERAQQYSSGSQPGNAASSAAASPPPANDCAVMLRRFQESSECLAPFMNVNGSFKPNAFETCGPPVPYPAQECSR